MEGREDGIYRERESRRKVNRIRIKGERDVKGQGKREETKGD